MKEACIKSLQMIEQYQITNKKDYAKLVKEYNLLNVITLEYIFGTSFKNIVKIVLENVA